MKNLSKKLGILIVAVIAFFSITVGALQLSKPVKADAIVETTNVITLLDKVQVRFPNTGKEMGMRFVFTVDDAEYDKLISEYDSASLGAILIPSDLLGESELTVDADNVLNVDLVNHNTNVDKETQKSISTYNAVLWNIPTSQYEREISTRGYIKLVKGSDIKYLYTEITAQRSIAQAMTMILNLEDIDTDEYDYVNNLLEQNLGTVSLDKQVYSIATGQTATVEVLGNKYGYELTADYLAGNATLTSDNEDVVVIENCNTIRAVADGVANITLKLGDIEKTAIVQVDSDYVATFEEENCVETVSHYYKNDNFKGSTTVEYLDEYEGEYGVIKITGMSNYGENGPINFGFGVTLPEAYQESGYTLRYRVEKISDEYGNVRPGVRYISVDDGFRYNDATSAWLPSNASWQTTNADKYGQWITQYCAPSGDTTKDKLGFVVSTVGNVDGVFGGWAIYLSLVMDGDQIANIPDFGKEIAIENIKGELKDGELLNCDSDAYKYLVSYYDHVDEARAGTANNDPNVKVGVEVLDEYAGEESVLKISGSQATGSEPINICVGIALPNAYTNGYTIRWRIEEQDEAKPSIRYVSVDDGFRYNATSFFLYGGTETKWGGVATVTDDRYDTWHTEYYNKQQNDTTKDKLGFVFSTRKQGGWTLYISFVMEGDQRENIKELENQAAIDAIKNALKGNELATFDSDAYKNLVSYYDHVEEARAGTVNNDPNVKVEVEVLNEYAGEESVLKISGSQATIYNPVNICVGITLPKAYTNGYTIKWRIEEQDASNPSIRYQSNDDGFRYSTTQSYHLYGGTETKWGGLTTVTDDRYDTWHTEYCYSQYDTTRDKLGFVFSTLNKGGWTLYISYVMDGDTTNA